MTKILLTGYKGFIGRSIYAELRENGYDVTGYDIGDSVGDDKYDFIVHFAARTLIRKSLEKPFEYYRDGLDLTMQFLEKARLDGSVFVFPTSGSIEEPTNPYSLTKKQAVEWIRLYEKLYGVKNHILKLYNIYGEGSGKGALYLFCKAAAENSEATIYGDGTHLRDYTYVSDVSRLILRIIKGDVETGIHEVGTGIGTSVRDLLHMVEEVAGRAIKVKEEPYVVSEAQELFARNSALIDPMEIREGIKRVYADLSRSA